MHLPPAPHPATRALRAVPVALAVLAAAPPPARAQAPDEPVRFEGLPRWYDVDTALPVQDARPRAETMATLDLLGDGVLDLARETFERVELLRQEDGALVLHAVFDPTAAGPLYDLPESYLTTDVAAGDLAGDAHDDLVVVGRRQTFPHEVVLQTLALDAAGTLTPGPIEPLPWSGDTLRHRLAVADVDQDGADDVVLVDHGGPFGTDRFGVRRGSPAVFEEYALEHPPLDVDVGDLDGDGAPEVVLLSVDAPPFGGPTPHDFGFVHVRWNDGAGRFDVGTDVGALTNPSGLRLADPDADGDLDVVAVSTTWPPHGVQAARTGVVVLENRGGTLADVAVVSEVPLGGGYHANGTVAARLDTDPHLDLAIAFNASQLTVGGAVVTLRGAGDLTFALHSAASFYAQELAFERDGATGEVRLFGGEGVVLPVDEDGRVGATALALPPSPDPFFETLLRPLAIVDHDRDGLLDVAVQASFLGEVHVFLADGEGGFAPLVLPAPAPHVTRELHAADANADGLPDYLLVGGDGLDFSVLLHPDGSGPGAGTLATFATPCEFPEVQGAAFADLDGDGDADGAITCEFSAVAHLVEALGDGSYAVQQVVLPEPGGRPSFADLTGDGHADLYWPSRTDGGLWLHAGVGDGTLAAPVEQTFAEGLYRPRPAAGDLDLDGDLDLVAVPAGPFSITSNGGGLLVLDNDGAGTFQLVQDVSHRYGFDPVRLADLDADGDLDAVGRRASSESSIHAFRNAGGVLEALEPGFDAVAAGVSSAVWGEVELADLDADGLPDAALGGYGSTPLTNGAFVAFNRSQLRAEGRLEAGNALALELREPLAAGMPYAVLLSSLGTYPGVALGADVLPLVHDPLLFPLTWSSPGGPLAGLLGALDGAGRADVVVPVPALGLPVEVPLDLAFVTLDATTGVLRASNAVGRTLR